MNSLTVILSILTIAVADNLQELRLPLQLNLLQSQFHAQDELGHYSYGYNAGFSNKAEYRALDGVTRGSYNYVDSDGKLQTVDYTADALNGFRVSGTNLPRMLPDLEMRMPEQVRDTPEVERARTDHLDAIQKEKLLANQLVSGMPLMKMGVLPKPVDDTPEVATAKRQHMAAVKMIQNRNLDLAKMKSAAPIDNNIFSIVPAIPAHFTPEVEKARTEHLEAIQKEKLLANQLVSGMPLMKMGVLPKPVDDTLEVATAKQQHMAAVKMIQNRNLDLAKMKSAAPIDNNIFSIVPAIPAHFTPEVEKARTEHLEAIQKEKLLANQLVSGMPLMKIGVLPKPVDDTAEVATAKRQHMEAVKLIENRNLDLAKMRPTAPIDNNIFSIVPIIPARFSYGFNKDGSFVDIVYASRLN